MRMCDGATDNQLHGIRTQSFTQAAAGVRELLPKPVNMVNTCSCVHKEADYHAERDHNSPGLYLLSAHAVEHRHAADMALRTETVHPSTRHKRTLLLWLGARIDTWKPKHMVGMALNTAVQEAELERPSIREGSRTQARVHKHSQDI